MKFVLRPFIPEYAEQCAILYYETIHSINSKDYNQEQLNAWAPVTTKERVERFKSFLSTNISFVVLKDDLVLGFSDLEATGYYNCLFVHKDFQGQGIALMLYEQIEKEALKLGIEELTTEASITAKPFFLSRGFILFKEQDKMHNGVLIKNFIMKKRLKIASGLAEF
jgi:putative acetyltransferase